MAFSHRWCGPSRGPEPRHAGLPRCGQVATGGRGQARGSGSFRRGSHVSLLVSSCRSVTLRLLHGHQTDPRHGRNYISSGRPRRAARTTRLADSSQRVLSRSQESSATSQDDPIDELDLSAVDSGLVWPAAAAATTPASPASRCAQLAWPIGSGLAPVRIVGQVLAGAWVAGGAGFSGWSARSSRHPA